VTARELGPDSAEARSAHAAEGRLFREADRVVVTTERMRDAVEAEHGIARAKITVVPNYVDTELFGPGAERPEPRSLIYVGRLAREKNIGALLEAAAAVDAALVTIVGGGPLRTDLERQAKDLGVDARFLGNVPNRQLPALLRRSELFVQPSFYEWHPKALLEAMSCGRAVIGCDVPGVSEVISHSETGYLAGTGADDLREAILALLGDPTLSARIGEAARRYVIERFSLDRIAALELELLREVSRS
jgi:glycosyltransferase involved in cell wall biosynthesis